MARLKSIAVLDPSGFHEVQFFDTIKQAQEDDIVLNMISPHMYSLYMCGEPVHALDWKLETDMSSNLKEIKKVNGAKRSGRYAPAELRALKSACNAGMSYKDMAKALFRTEASVRLKAIAMGYMPAPKPRKKNKRKSKEASSIPTTSLDARRENITKRNAALGFGA